MNSKQLEIEGRQAIIDVQEMINPKWNEPLNGNYDGPLDLLFKQVRSCRDLSGARKAIYAGDKIGKLYAEEHAMYKKDYKHFLEQPFGQVDIEGHMIFISEDENRTKNFKAIIHNILVREDLLMLDFELIDQLYRIHQLANANKRG